MYLLQIILVTVADIASHTLLTGIGAHFHVGLECIYYVSDLVSQLKGHTTVIFCELKRLETLCYDVCYSSLNAVTMDEVLCPCDLEGSLESPSWSLIAHKKQRVCIVASCHSTDIERAMGEG